MKAPTSKQCAVADACGVSGVFKNTATSWPYIKTISGEVDKEVPSAEAKPATWPQLLAAVVVNVNVFAMGSSLVWPAMALPQLLSADGGLRERPLSADEASWVASLLLLAAIPLYPVYAAAGARLGRKLLGYVVITPLLACWVIKMFSTSNEALYAARSLAGVHSAGALLITTLYVSETTSEEVRGAVGCMLPLMCNAGILFAYVIGAFLPYNVVLYVNLAPGVLFIVLFAFMPETPYRLASVHRNEQARQALRWLRRGISEQQVGRELLRIQASLGAAEGEGGVPTVRPAELTSRAALRGFANVVNLALNMQLCGSFAVLNYAVLMFDEAGGSLPSDVATIILGALQVVGTLLATLVIDRLGRRPLLFLSNAVVGSSVAILGVYMYLKQETQVELSSVGWLPATCLSIYVLVLALGLNSLPYVVLAEVVSPRIRGLASIASYTVISIAATALTKLYPDMSEAMGTYGAFWFFAAVCLVCSCIGWWLLPETKGRPLEDILKELNGGKDVIVISNSQ